ncbi:MAG: DUF4159 domain-containing protein [Gammaproteobacteria bacterium]|nr:DUF4159 domain-containing protein [Gammaproteobacteria bacterium]MDE0358970.1 DUF4159 domain-containing protein [Gammaproteobacteria bacterium]
MSRERRWQKMGGGWRGGAIGIALAAGGISAAAVLSDGPSLGSATAAVPTPTGLASDTPAPIPGAPPGLPLPEEAQQGRPLPMHEFYFTRAAYSGGGGGFRRWRRQSWATDYPKSDRQFLIVAERLTGLDMFMEEHPRTLTDEHLNRFPFLYALEVGGMSMTPEEATALRDYLLRGGFLVVDDFWGTYEWEIFEYEMQKVLPEYPIVDVPLEHEIFHTFYDIDEIIQVPNVNNGRSGWRTHERDGYEPFVKGIFDEEGRLMVIINWNTDLGDAWEWAEDPYYPLRYSTYAIQMGVNFIIYAMSH